MNLTTREIHLAKSALDYLHSLEGAQVVELQIHAAMIRDPAVHPNPSGTEVEAIVRLMSERKWIGGVPGFGGGKMKWSITDAGEAARQRLND